MQPNFPYLISIILILSKALLEIALISQSTIQSLLLQCACCCLSDGGPSLPSVSGGIAPALGKE